MNEEKIAMPQGAKSNFKMSVGVIIAIIVVSIIGGGLIYFKNRTATDSIGNNQPGNLSDNQAATAPAANSKKVLDLSNQGLERLPAEVLKMESLEELNISANKLTGALPGEIRFLKQLKKLKAGNNLMTGIPAEIGQLALLEELDFSNNQLTGLPLEIKNLTKLKILNLTGNNYSKTDLSQIKIALPNLKVIGE